MVYFGQTTKVEVPKEYLVLTKQKHKYTGTIFVFIPLVYLINAIPMQYLYFACAATKHTASVFVVHALQKRARRTFVSLYISSSSTCAAFNAHDSRHRVVRNTVIVVAHVTRTPNRRGVDTVCTATVCTSVFVRAFTQLVNHQS
jgi:hypothetical protein